MFAAGQTLSAEAAAALSEMWRQYLKYGFRVGVTSWPLSRAENGKAGQVIGIDPKVFRDSTRLYKSVTDVCLVSDGYGGVAGLALFEEYADGHAECRVVGFCEDCGSADVPVSPPSPAPPPPPTPPDPPPETYDVFMVVYENEPDPVSGLCSGGTSVGTYTVAVGSSTQGSQVVPAGGIWFTGIPWGTDSSAVISGTSGTVSWGVTSAGCGGATGFGSGTTAPINGSTCDNVSVSFAVGDCGPVPPATSMDVIEVVKEVEEVGS